MPPKKQPDKKKEEEPEEPPGYNINIMNQDQLKQYARLLEKEIEDMRRRCNFFQKMEDELMELLRITEEDLRQREDYVLLKDVGMETLKLNFLKHMREKKQWPKYMEHESITKEENLSSATSDRLEQEEIRHLLEKKRLKAILQEKDRQLEALRVKIQMSRRETKEVNEEDLRNMDDHQKNLLEQSMQKFDDMMAEAQREFQQAKEVMECEAREGKSMAERAFNDACEIFKNKLHDYYKGVTKQDIEVIKKLKREIKKAEEDIESSKVLLHEAQKENNVLKEANQPRVTKRGFAKGTAKFDSTPLKMHEALKMHNRTEKLALANQKLEEDIKKALDQTYELRRQFTLALKKVRESAEMKSSFLERKLRFIMDEKKRESSSTSPEHSEKTYLEISDSDKSTDQEN